MNHATPEKTIMTLKIFLLLNIDINKMHNTEIPNKNISVPVPYKCMFC